MTDYLERRVRAALHPGLADALVGLYTRHLADAAFGAALRALVAGEPSLEREFDRLDRLHVAHPFASLSSFGLEQELALLYWQDRQATGDRPLREPLRRLCAGRRDLLATFDRFDAASIPDGREAHPADDGPSEG